MSAEEETFLHRAQRKFAENANWLEFEEFAFGSRSPLYSRTRSHQDVLQHPLYPELKEMWLDLGVRQGRIKKEPDATRRKARGSR